MCKNTHTQTHGKAVKSAGIVSPHSHALTSTHGDITQQCNSSHRAAGGAGGDSGTDRRALCLQTLCHTGMECLYSTTHNNAAVILIHNHQIKDCRLQNESFCFIMFSQCAVRTFTEGDASPQLCHIQQAEVNMTVQSRSALTCHSRQTVVL